MFSQIKNFFGRSCEHDFSKHCIRLQPDGRYRYFSQCIKCEKEDKESEFYHDNHDFNISITKIKSQRR